MLTMQQQKQQQQGQSGTGMSEWMREAMEWMDEKRKSAKKLKNLLPIKMYNKFKYGCVCVCRCVFGCVKCENIGVRTI